MSQTGKAERLASSSRGAYLAKRHTASCLPLPRSRRAASASLADLECYVRRQEGSPGRHSGAGSLQGQVDNPMVWVQEVITQHKQALRQIQALQDHVVLLKSKVDSQERELAERQADGTCAQWRMSEAAECGGCREEQKAGHRHQRWLTSGADSRRKSVSCGCECEGRVADLVAANRALTNHVEELTTRCDSLVVITSELGCQNSLLRGKMHQLNAQLAEKDDQLADQGEELGERRAEVGRLQGLVAELEGELQAAKLLQGEVECWREKHQFVLAALADKESVIMELLDRVHLLEGAGPEGPGGVGVSEDLMNHNQKLESTISWLENQVRLREEHISSLKVELLDQQDKCKRMTLSLDTAEHQRRVLEIMEMRQDLLRAALSDKDSKMASLEGRWLQKGRSQVTGQLACLRVEREELVTELKRLHQQSMVVRRLVRKESSSELYQKCRGASREQVLLEVHRLNSTADKLKQFIDYFLSVVMETNPSLLEGLPSLQHNTGVQPHILAAAGKSELLLELQSQEQGCRHLQHYSTLLLGRVADRDPTLLDQLTGRGRGQGKSECPL